MGGVVGPRFFRKLFWCPNIAIDIPETEKTKTFEIQDLQSNVGDNLCHLRGKMDREDWDVRNRWERGAGLESRRRSDRRWWDPRIDYTVVSLPISHFPFPFPSAVLSLVIPSPIPSPSRLTLTSDKISVVNFSQSHEETLILILWTICECFPESWIICTPASGSWMRRGTRARVCGAGWPNV